MFTSLRRFLYTHPSVRDALLWAIPALLLGGLLRACLLYYFPYAYWGSDSRSYFDFSYKLFVEHYVSLVEKRRFLYPIFIACVTILPGSPLQWLAWIQHGFGLATLVPLAYVVRKNFVLWKWWIAPVTVLYAAHPVILWYEHELLAENVVFALVVWSFAGWTAWVHEPARARALRLWWVFFAPFALLILTRPAARFYWPGVLVGLVLVAAWRRMARAQWMALAALIVVTPFVGSRTQGAWLLYVATFPLTQLETPLHADYKAEIRDLVLPLRQNLDTYHTHDEGPFNFLENPDRSPERPRWAALQKDHKLRTRIYMDLAVEAIRTQPIEFITLGLQRVAASANISRFKQKRFEADSLPQRFQDDYATALKRVAKGESTPVPLALGYPAKGPLPPWDEFRQRLSPAPDSWPARFVPAFVAAYLASADLVVMPADEHMTKARPTQLGWWLLGCIALACLVPRYRPALGVWTIAAVGYLCAVFMVSQVNTRYFAAAWPVLIPVLAVPADFLLSRFRDFGRPASTRATPSRRARE
jgi:hypothetical protein